MEGNFSRAGQALNSMTLKAESFLSNHMWLWAFLNIAWGFPMTVFGAVLALSLLCLGKKPERFMLSYAFKIGKSWGGLEGIFFMFVCSDMDDSSELKMKCHEFGHSFQNAIFGPLFPFIIGIPSAIRYWIRHFKQKKGIAMKPYDSIWFEHSATEAGTAFYEKKVYFVDSKIKSR